VTVDVYQELGGEAARRAHLDETGDPGGPPNDYMTRNQSPELRTLPVSVDAAVWLRPRDEGYPGTERQASFNELPAYFGELSRVYDGPPVPDEEIAFGRQLATHSHFLMTVEDGAVTRLCEGYYP
jgi:hypothetical protein